MKLLVQGFYENEKQFADSYTDLPHFPMDGYKLDQIQIAADLHSIKDIDDLITILINSKPCFKSGLKEHTIKKLN